MQTLNRAVVQNNSGFATNFKLFYAHTEQLNNSLIFTSLKFFLHMLCTYLNISRIFYAKLSYLKFRQRKKVYFLSRHLVVRALLKTVVSLII